MKRSLRIFVHRASELLTDSESHGDGLICFSLLNGLAERGHHIYAFTDRSVILNHSPNLFVRAAASRTPIHSLAPWEQSWRAERWGRRLLSQQRFDLVWRMHPFGQLPYCIPTWNLPLVIGPIFWSWPPSTSVSPRPRFGIGVGKRLTPALLSGWNKTLSRANLVFCATQKQVDMTRDQLPLGKIELLPVIAEAPADLPRRPTRDASQTWRLVFVANLVPNKNPMLFIEIIAHLANQGLPVTGTIIGDGPERAALLKAVHHRRLPVAFCGKITNAEVWPALQNADFLISTSLGEPYGRGIVEAMAVGTPCICHRSGGPSELIEDRLTGLLAEELDSETYARSFRWATEEPTRWDMLSRKARERAADWGRSTVLDTAEREITAMCAATRRQTGQEME